MLRFTFSQKIVTNSVLYRSYHGLTGGQIVYKKLKENNVKDVWISTGGAVMPLVDSFYSGDINYYLPSHEQSGGHAATGYAKSSGNPGISIVTSGPGFTNSLTPLTDAMNDGVPMILFSGQVSLKSMNTQAFQECPSVDMSKPVTKWSYCVDDVHKLPDVIDEAFIVATSGKPGAVHIDLPKCVTSSTFYQDKEIKRDYYNNYKTKDELSQTTIQNLIDIINLAEKPVIIAGQGCNNSYQVLRDFVIKYNIPITTTIHAMGCFDELHPLSLQFLGMHGNAAANYAVQDADLIIALGTRFDDRITGKVDTFAPKCFEAFQKGKGGIIHVNINKSEINYVIDTHYNFNMDCGNFLNQINSKIKTTERNKWLNKINNWKNKYPFSYKKLSYGIKTQDVISEINNSLLRNNFKDYFVTTGVGNHQMMAAQFIKWRYPKSYISSGSLGTMGVGLPYAIGCQIANPNNLVIDIDGDGSFNHSLHELKSVNDHNLPIKIAIMNDGKLSMVKAWEKLFYNERYTATDLGKNPNYVKLAESFGIKGIQCNNKNDLPKVVDYFLNYDGPILCDFKVEGDLCLPLVAPGSSIDNMFLYDNDNLIKKMKISNVLPPG
jgi:acetolactate synthase I/II/III large subunit